MRHSRAAAATLALAVALGACHPHYTKPPNDAADPAGAWGEGLDGGERARLIETDARILAEASAFARSAADAARLEADARELGLSSGRELLGIVDRGCLEPEDVGRFAVARGVGTETAARYLSERFGVGACGRAR